MALQYLSKGISVIREEQILDERVRKQIIEEINSDENQARREQSYKWYECFKDRTKFYVIDALLKQFDLKTVEEMTYAISNISVIRKVINKLAMVYSFGVSRTLSTKDGKSVDEAGTQELGKAEQALDFNSKMKKANRFLKLQKNIMVLPRPVQTQQSKWAIKLDIKQPYQYDIIPDPYDPEEPMVMIESNFCAKDRTKYTTSDPAVANRGVTKYNGPIVESDGKNQAIADGDDSAVPEGIYIWWSANYHFTTDSKGVIQKNINGEIDTKNEIGMFPAVKFAIDQDGKFWAEGGDDLIDGGILLNCVISHMNHVGVNQGYGQFWMKGQKVPTSVAMGPSKMIRLEYSEDETEPEIGYAQSNPPLAELRENVIMYAALLLTTNNLSTSGVSTKLDGSNSFPAGIAMIIDKAESMEDIEDQRQIFVDNEPQIWKRVGAWMRVFGSKNMLTDEFSEIKLPEEVEPKLEFGQPKPIVSEKEHLDALKSRQDLGINTMLDLIKKDNPGFTDEQARAKMQEVMAEKEAKMKEAMANAEQMGSADGPVEEPQPEVQAQD